MHDTLKHHRKYGTYDECDSNVLALFKYWPWIILLKFSIIGWLVVGLNMTLLIISVVMLSLFLVARQAVQSLFDDFFPGLSGDRVVCHSVYTEGVNYDVVPEE